MCVFDNGDRDKISMQLKSVSVLLDDMLSCTGRSDQGGLTATLWKQLAEEACPNRGSGPRRPPPAGPGMVSVAGELTSLRFVF